MKRKTTKRLPVVLAGFLLAMLGGLLAVQADGRIYYDDLGNAALLLTGAEGCSVTYWPEGADPESGTTIEPPLVAGEGFTLQEIPELEPGTVYEFQATCEVPEGFSLEGRFVANVGLGSEPMTGRVVDGEGNPVAGAVVLVRPLGTSVGSWTTTGEDGRFSVPLVETGSAGIAPGPARFGRRGSWMRFRPRMASPRELLVTASAPGGGVGATVVRDDETEVTVTVEEAAEGCVAQVCNVTSRTFAAFWESAAETTGSIRYGLDPADLDARACDVRDRPGNHRECEHVGDVHYVFARHLLPETTYWFQVYEGDLPVGDACQVTTGPELSHDAPGYDPKSVAYGTVVGSDGVTPFPDAVVVTRLRDGDETSAPICLLTAVLTHDGYNWLAPVGLARTGDGTGWYQETDETIVVEEAFGGAEGHAIQEVPYDEAAPSPPLVLGSRAFEACPDEDGDGYAVCDDSCDPGELECGDCDDANADVNPGAVEACDNGIDDDCDGLVDADDPDCQEMPACPDEDGDGYAVCDDSCDPGELDCGDCDDANADVNPGVTEVCDDGIDNDCDGAVDGDDADCMEPGEIAPLTPPAGAAFTTCSEPPTFSWTDGGFTRFYVTMSTSPDFGGETLVFGEEQPFEATSWTPTPGEWSAIVGLARGSVDDLPVYWRVTGVSDAGEQPGSVSNFVILAQAVPVPTSPADGSRFTEADTPPTFAWEPGECNGAFRLEFSLSPDFEPPVVLLPGTPLTTSSWTPPMVRWSLVTGMASRGEGPEEVTVYWRVVARDDLGRQVRSAASSLVVEAAEAPMPRPVRRPRRFSW